VGEAESEYVIPERSMPPSTPNVSADPADAWSEAKNARRCDLIDREVDGVLTFDEAAELKQLQGEMLRYRRKLAPLPIEDARKLQQELLAKASQVACSDQR
jgi:hypothetical protein